MTIRTDCRPETEVRGQEQAEEHIHGICLKTGPPRRVGVELEWLVRDSRDPALPVGTERIAAAVSLFTAADGRPAPGAAPKPTPLEDPRSLGGPRSLRGT